MLGNERHVLSTLCTFCSFLGTSCTLGFKFLRFKFSYTTLPLEVKWSTRIIKSQVHLSTSHDRGVFNHVTGVLIMTELALLMPLTQITYVRHAPYVWLLRFVHVSRTSRKQLAFGCCCTFQIVRPRAI